MFVVLCLAFPLCLLLIFAAIGLAVKKCSKKERSIICNEIYRELVFSTFLRIANIYQLNLIYNGIKYLVMISEDIPFVEELRPYGCVLVYFNFLTYFALLYLKVYVLNPKKGQTSDSF
jgi:hypothetical protein